MARRLLVVLAALVVGAVLFLLLWRPAPRGPPAPRVAGAGEVPRHDAGARALRQRAAVSLVAAPPPLRPPPALAGAVEGQVRSALTGRGLPGAQLTFSSGEGAASVSGAADGSFRLDPPTPGRWWLAAVTAPGHQPFAPEWGQSPVALDVRAGEVLRGVTVALLPSEPYQGRVVGADGRPLEGALVTILGGGLGQTTLVPLPAPLRSGHDGAFQFTAPDEAVLVARLPGYATGRARVDYAARVSRRLTLRLAPLAGGPASLGIEGTVEDAAGRPAEGAAVSATPRPEPDAPPALARADSHGRFLLEDLAPGAWAVTASLPGAAPAHAEAEAGATGLRLRLTSGGRLEGRVRDRRTGAPVALFTVMVLGAEPRVASVIDGRGRFELGGLTPGAATVTVLSPGHAPSPERRVVIPEPGASPAWVDVELGGGGRLTGRVVERGTGTPIGGARVEIEGSPSSSGVPIRNETLTDDVGRFALDAVAARAVGLFASAPGHHARVFPCPPVPEGETVGPITVDLAPLQPGEAPRIELAGIGAGLEKRGEVLRVTMVAPTGGAAEAGLEPGDEILAIDGAPVAGMSLADAIPLIRGPEGSVVTLAVVKAGDVARRVRTVQVPRRLVRT